MNRFKFKKTPDCPQGEYVLLADERFRVEVQGRADFIVVELPFLNGSFVKINHHGRHADLDAALHEAAERAVPIKKREPWRMGSRAGA